MPSIHENETSIAESIAALRKLVEQANVPTRQTVHNIMKRLEARNYLTRAVPALLDLLEVTLDCSLHKDSANYHSSQFMTQVVEKSAADLRRALIGSLEF